jgi:hypothetical protein
MVVIVVLMTLTPRGFFALFGHSVEVLLLLSRGAKERKKQPRYLGKSGRGVMPGLFRGFRKHGQNTDNSLPAKKKGFRLEYRKPLLVNALIGCGGQI